MPHALVRLDQSARLGVDLRRQILDENLLADLFDETSSWRLSRVRSRLRPPQSVSSPTPATAECLRKLTELPRLKLPVRSQKRSSKLWDSPGSSSGASSSKPPSTSSISSDAAPAGVRDSSALRTVRRAAPATQTGQSKHPVVCAYSPFSSLRTVKTSSPRSWLNLTLWP